MAQLRFVRSGLYHSWVGVKCHVSQSVYPVFYGRQIRDYWGSLVRPSEITREEFLDKSGEHGEILLEVLEEALK